MIIGIGTDLVKVERIALALARHGERFARRILSPTEHEELTRSRSPERLLAKRFAVKEAAVKALGVGFAKGIHWSDVETVHTTLGQPILRFTGTALQIAEGLGVGEAHLSVTDDGDYALAFVTLLRKAKV